MSGRAAMARAEAWHATHPQPLDPDCPLCVGDMPAEPRRGALARAAARLAAAARRIAGGRDR